MKSILGIFLSSLLGVCLGYSCRQIIAPTHTTAEKFPYHAIIKTSQERKRDTVWCNGALISNKFVLTRGTCVVYQKGVTVYLGFSRNPYFPNNRQDPNGQIFGSKNIYMHEEFGYLQETEQIILNNLALIELDKYIVITNTVKPISIASPDDFPIPPGTFINQTGFQNVKVDDYLRFATVQENYIDMCDQFYGNTLLPVQENCVRQEGVDRNTWVGPYVVDGVLIGFQRSLRANTTCFVTTPPCDINDVYMSLEPALLWIYKVSGVAGVDAKGYFQSCNPYWEKPRKITTILAPPPPPQPEDPINIDPELINEINKAILQGLERSVC